MKTSFKKISAEFEIVELEDKKTFTVKKDEAKITFYDELLIEEYIEKNFNNKYKRLLYIIMDINNNEDATTTDAQIVRDQILELKNLLLNKYSHYINKELLNKYLKMLIILEGKLIVPKITRGR